MFQWLMVLYINCGSHAPGVKFGHAPGVDSIHRLTMGKTKKQKFLSEPEIKMKRLESPPSGHFMIVARVPVAPVTIRRHIVSETKPML